MLRHPYVSTAPSVQEELAHAREVLLVESSALSEVAGRLDESFSRAVAAINECTGSVIVTGMGKAGLIGNKVVATLASTGTRSHFLHPAEACHGDLGRVTQGDVVLAFSHSGETQELLQIIPSLHDLGTTVISVTSRATSQLAIQSDIRIIYGKIDEACPIGLAPSTSCAVMLAIGDALAFVIMRRQQFGPEDFRRFHPAGSLGKRLRRVDDVMRKGGQLRVASSQLSVRDVFVSGHRPGRRTGAICLVDSDGRLDGIFTDSDLARLLEAADLGLLSRPIREFMTCQPITVESGTRVSDVLDLFKARQISEIPVIDAEKRPLGIVDITDLLDLLPEAA